MTLDLTLGAYRSCTFKEKRYKGNRVLPGTENYDVVNIIGLNGFIRIPFLHSEYIFTNSDSLNLIILI